MNQIATYMALGLVALFFAFVAWVLIWRARTARLSLSVSEGKILPGDTVDAVLRLEAKRPLEWDRIVVSLTCEDTKSDNDSSQRHLLYRDDAEVSGSGRLGAGAIAEFPVQFKMPTVLAPSGIGLEMPDAVEAVLAPLMDITQTYRDRDFKWQIEAHVDCKMILSTGRRLNFELAP